MKAIKLYAGAVAALLPLAGAIAQSPTPEPAAEPAQPAQSSQQGVTFESLDKDNDGRISKSEAAANTNVTQQFTKYDQNGNGFIERDEVISSNNAPPANPPKE
jgi:hypothetical protein